MSVGQMRPTFELTTDGTSEDVMRCLREAIDESCDRFQGQFTTDHAMISYAESGRQFWSPWLHIEIRPEGERQEVFCRFSPHPSVWTGFMLAYLAIGVLIFFAGVFGVSQQLSGAAPTAYLAIPLLVVVATLLWIASKIGQKLATRQMEEMRERIQRCVQETNQQARTEE